jgi:Insect cuticle protein
VKDVNGRVQGEYSYYDKEGKLHFVQYEAGPGIGYRVVNTNDGKPTQTAGKPFAVNS